MRHKLDGELQDLIEEAIRLLGTAQNDALEGLEAGLADVVVVLELGMVAVLGEDGHDLIQILGDTETDVATK